MVSSNTPNIKNFSFPDARGITFSYDPADNGDHDAFVAWARRYADDFKKTKEKHLATVGNESDLLFAELLPDDEKPFFVVIPEGENLRLDRDQIEAFRDGLTRILETEAQARENGGSERQHAPTFWAMEAGYLVSEVAVDGSPN